MRCRFCFATFTDIGKDLLPKGHLNREDCLSVVEATAAAGFDKINFAGGEPTLCPWLPDLIWCAKDLGCTTSMVTNCPASTIFAGWRQSVLPVHLLGLAPLLGSIGPVAGDVKLQDDGVVHDPVNRRGGGHGVGEDALPLREDQV